MKKIFLSILACTALFFGCTIEEPVNPGNLAIDVTPSLLSFSGKTAGSAEVTVNAKAAWTVSVPAAAAEWLTVNPASGGAGEAQKVTVSVLIGGDAARSAEVVFKAGEDKKILTVSQEGGVVWGTKDNPYTCTKACEFCATLADKAKGPKEVYVKGIITKIVEKYGTTYGNATFFMSDDGTESSPQFEVYRALYFDNQKYDDTSKQNISVGDQVMVYGMIQNYGGQAETSQNEAYLVSLEAGTLPVLTAGPASVTVAASDTAASFDVESKNVSGGWTVSTDAAWITDYTKSGTDNGKIEVKFEANTGAERTAKFVVKAAGVKDVELTLTQAEYQENGTADKPYTVAEALEVISKLEDGAKTPTEVYVSGIVSFVKEVSAQYGNASYNISANGADENFISVYRGKYIDGAAFTDEGQLAVGDVVVIKGQLQKYVKNGVTTPQVAQNNILVSLDRPLTVAQALEAIDKMEDGKTADEVIMLRGIVVGANGIDTGYGNATFKVSDDGSEAATVTVYRAKSYGNEKFTTDDVFKAGDTVILKGQLQRYVKSGAMTPELTKGWLVAVIPGAGSAASGIKIDGDFSDWASVEGATGTGINAAFKVASDNDNIYFYVKRTTERISDIWGGAAYHYYTFDLDNNAATGVELWGNGPYELLLVVYPYAGTADAPAFGIAAEGAAMPENYKVSNAVIKGLVSDSGVETEVSIPRADLPAMAGVAAKVYEWSNKGGGDKLEVSVTL